MIVSLILCALMAGVIFFFVVSCNNFSIISIIVALFLMYLYAAMTFSEHKKKGSGTIYRRIFLISYAVFFCISFVGDLFIERGSMAITNEAMANGEIPFCHIAIPQTIIAFFLKHEVIFPARLTGHYASISSMLAIWLICTLTLGRGWCSWVCFYGGWDEGFSRLGKKRKINLLSRNKEIREFQFGFFAFIVLASLGVMSAIYCSWFCPFKLVTEFNPMTTILGLIEGVIFIGLFLALVVVMPILTKRRTQCSSLCPFGAFASLTDKASLFQMKIDTDKCKSCLKCAMECPFGAIDIKTIQDKKGHPEITCSKCGECIKACPEKAISYQFRFQKKCSKPEAKTKFAKALQEFLDPSNLFRFAAFSFGVIMAGSCYVTVIQRMISFFAK